MAMKRTGPFELNISHKSLNRIAELAAELHVNNVGDHSFS